MPAHVIPVGAPVVVNAEAPLVVIALLVVWTITYARRAQARGEQRGVQLPATPSEAGPGR